MCAGVTLLMQATQVGLTLSTQGRFEGSFWTGLREGSVLFLRNVVGAGLYFEASPLDSAMPTQTTYDIDVWGLWVPALLSALFILTGVLGFSTLRHRRPVTAAAYAVVAAVLVVLAAEAGRSLKEMAKWEDLGQMPEQTAIFKASYETFSQLYKDSQCSVDADKPDSNWITCSGDTLEAQLLQVLVQEVCQPPGAGGSSAETEFTNRAATCRKRGRELKMLAHASSETDDIFCRCWCATFDWFGVLSQSFVVIWLGLLLGVLSVLHAAAEPKLATMCPVERAEVLTFAGVAMSILACRVTLFSDGFPLSMSSLLGL